MLIKHTRTGVGIIAGTVALLLILAAALVELGRQLAPLVEDNRQALEHYLSERLGAQVRVDSLQAEWRALRPQLSLTGLTLMADESPSANSGEASLSARRASAQVDLWRSLLDWRLRLRSLQLEGVQARFVQTTAGVWTLAGLPLSSDTAADAPPDHPIDILLTGRDIQMQDIRLAFDFASERRQSLQLTDMLLQNSGDFHRLNARLDLPRQDRALQLVYEGEGDLRRTAQSTGRGFLELKHYPLQEVAAFVSEELALSSGVSDGLLSARLWLHKEAGQTGHQLRGDLTYERGPYVMADTDAGWPQQLTARLYGELRPGDWRLDLQDTRLQWAGETMPALNLVVAAERGAGTLTVQSPQLNLAEWLPQLQHLQPLPATARRILGELGVTGVLHDLQLELPLAAPETFRLRSNLRGGTVQEWKGVPQIQGLDGYLEASALSGFVAIDNQRALSAHFPKQYSRAFEFDRLQGIVRWQVEPDNNQVVVESGRLNAHSELGQVQGYFYLDAPLQRHSRPLELMLQIGLRDGQAAGHERLVPYSGVPAGLLDWLDKSVAGGQVPAGGFLLHGYFGPDAPRARSLELGLQVRNAELKFDPRWPALQEADGYLSLADGEVRAWLDRGRLLNARLLPGFVAVRPQPQDKPLLEIRGALDGSAQSGLELVTATPIGDMLKGQLDDWQISGSLSARAQLQISLGNPAAQRQRVEVQLADNSLTTGELGLELENIHGELHYTDRHGLQAEQLQASLWQQPLQIQIGAGPEPGSTQLNFAGRLDFADLKRWSRRPEAGFFEGEAPVSGQLRLGGGHDVRLSLSSELQGVSVSLPQPYGKAAAEGRQLTADINLSRQQQYRFAYDDLVSVWLTAAPDSDLRGSVSLGRPAPAPTEPGLRILGQVETLDGRLWQPVLARYQQQREELAAPPVDGATNSTPAPEVMTDLTLDLMIERLLWDGIALHSVHIGGGLQQGGWGIRLENERVSGELQLAAQAGEPARVQLDYLRWPSAAPDQSLDKSDWSGHLAGVDPAELPPLDLVIGELRLGETDLGHWSLQMRPRPDGVQLSRITAEVGGIEVSGHETGGAELYWRRTEDQHSTQFRGRLSGGNLDTIARHWGVTPMMESQRVSTLVDIHWPGSPLEFDVAELTGELTLAVQDGRFYRSTGQASNAFLRLVGLFNFDNWVRRLQLDFSDVFQRGTPFERIDGSLAFESGMLYLTDPLTVKNTSSLLQMGGELDLVQEDLDLSLVATLPAGGNATVIAALAGGLPAAAGVYAISKIFQKQVAKVASVSYRIRGDWDDPDIAFDRLFDDKAAAEASADSQRSPRPAADD